jgi:hypothetical protein
MREGAGFVIWFITWGTAVVLVVIAISVLLFRLLKRWSDRQTREHQSRHQ